ncbi:hypothetical protein ACIPL1_28525 [Pseudomonas sp. NPDC090202]|uniref:hypothetical protein n=1 Tax=unclassified Pseudomonas TaxID=196821 RepID=UPI00380C62A2
MSTLSEIAANLLKRERMTEEANAKAAVQHPMGWEQLMALSKEKDIEKWQATLSDMIAHNTGKRVTVMRVIEGGLS